MRGVEKFEIVGAKSGIIWSQSPESTREQVFAVAKFGAAIKAVAILLSRLIAI